MRNTSYEDMDPELRKEVARDSVKKTTVIRVAIAALLIGMTIYNKLSGIAAVVLIAVAILIVVTLIPVWVVMNQNMKFKDEKQPPEE